MSEEIERVSKKEINRTVNDSTYKPEVNLRAPKHKPYKRKKNVDYYDQAEEEESENWADDVEFFGRYPSEDEMY